MKGIEYIIVGETKEFGDCLIYTCGKSKEDAEQILQKMLTNPDKEDLFSMRGHTNFRVKAVMNENCWWNQGSLD